MMKLVKISTSDSSWDIFENFLEDYFKTKAENQSMKNSIIEQIEILTEEKQSLLGKVFMAKNDVEKFELMTMLEKKNEQIINLEKSMSEREIVEKLSSKTHLADLIEEGNSNFDIGIFSRIVKVKNMGRTNLFKWMKDNKILMKNNVPYQQYMEYFNVIPITTGSGFTNTKTLLKPKGVDFLMKRLIKDGKIITKSVDDVLKELEEVN